MVIIQLSTNEQTMDHRKSTKRSRSEDAMKANAGDIDNLSLVNTEPLFPIPGMMFDMSDSETLISCDLRRGFHYGIWKRKETRFVFKWSMNRNRVIVADLENRRLEVFKNKVMTYSSGTQGEIDLNTNGRRWEGGVRNGRPCGYGILYDEEGRKKYEGFMMDGMKSCYGIEYYSNIGRVKYQGSYYDNKRFGKGVLYDRNGVVEHDGLWKSNQPYSPHFDGKTVDSLTALLDVPNSSFNESRFFCLYSFIHSLKRIVIGNECFGRVRSFELNGLRELESIEIGNCSCRISDDERGDGVCRMVNCPKLVSIQIGKESFCDYQSFELTNLPSLLSIGIGSKCFIFASSFLLIGLITGLVYYHRSSSTTICQV